jgi:endonuclease/exonuclease/phosphatase family metal-dependent hydrolase
MGGKVSSELQVPLHRSSDNFTQSPEVKVLTLNMFLRPPPVKTNLSDHKEARTDYLISNVLDNYDIICLQEVFDLLNDRKERIIQGAIERGLHYYATSPRPSFFSKELIDGGLLVLSRFPIVETDFYGFGNGTLPDLLTYKGVLYCKILINSEPIHVFTTHTQASYDLVDPIYRQIRKEQISVMRKIISDKLKSPQDFAIFLGDFNVMTSQIGEKELYTDSEYADLIKMLSCDGVHEVKDVIHEAYGHHPSTYGRVDETGKALETVLTHPICATCEECLDYIFTINAKHSWLTADLGQSRVQPFETKDLPFTQISDHAGLETVLRPVAG